MQPVRRQQPDDRATVMEAFETALVERQVEEDEQRAAAEMAASSTRRNVASGSDSGSGSAILEPTGYMVLALQEQMMLLKASVGCCASRSGATFSRFVCRHRLRRCITYHRHCRHVG